MGGGLEIWDITYEDINQAYKQGGSAYVEKYKQQKIASYISYSAGVMLLQKGLYMHRIARRKEVNSGDIRITLQGHGLRFSGEWILYW